jgi:hypothetical protein
MWKIIRTSFEVMDLAGLQHDASMSGKDLSTTSAENREKKGEREKRSRGEFVHKRPLA